MTLFRLFMVAWLACAAAHAGASSPVPGDWRVQGEAQMRWFGFSLYDARLWTPQSQAWPSDRAPTAKHSFALELRYARDIPGARLVQVSLDEMRRLGWRDEARLRRWQDDLAKVFPDVRTGDVIVGRHMPQASGDEAQAAFFHQGQPTGMFTDPELATAFFAIWLDPRTREPGLRARLIGESP